MRPFVLFIIVITALSSTLIGCSAEKDAPETAQPTPPEVQAQFFELLDNLSKKAVTLPTFHSRFWRVGIPTVPVLFSAGCRLSRIIARRAVLTPSWP